MAIKIIQQRTEKVFTYGTLKERYSDREMKAGILKNYSKEKLPEPYNYFIIKKKDGAEVEGFYFEVTTDELYSIDCYEGIHEGYMWFYKRIKEKLSDGTEVWIYAEDKEFSKLNTTGRVKI